MPLTVGLPRMHREAGERRDFLPDFVRKILGAGASVVVEYGIGSGMGLSDDNYTGLSPNVRAADNLTAWKQDLVLVLRSPEVEEYSALLRSGTTLVSMLHFPTRPRRIRKLKELGCDAIGLDSLAHDDGRRLVENTRAVGWNGLEAAFEALQTHSAPRLSRTMPLRVTVMGAGQVGKHAVEAALKYGSLERFRDWSDRMPPVEVCTVGRSLTGDTGYLRSRFGHTDILVDATQRSDSTRPLIPNEWIGWLPPHAVICDLVVDPYVPTGAPPTVRSIEGIPKGDLDKWIFTADDPDWRNTIPADVPCANRRTTVSCYSWPGIHPEECMRHYGRQLWPLLERLLARGGVDGLSARGDSLERALHRASVRSWLADGDRVERVQAAE